MFFFVTPTRWSVNLSDSRGGKSSSPPPPQSLTVSFPRKIRHPQFGNVYQPPFLRGELLNFRGASMSSHFQMVVSFIFYFHPDPWGRFPFWRAYFSKGLKSPTRFATFRWFPFSFPLPPTWSLPAILACRLGFQMGGRFLPRCPPAKCLEVGGIPIGSMYGIFNYVHLPSKSTKCRCICHTWILWDIGRY